MAHDTLLHLNEGTLRGWKSDQQKVTCAFSVRQVYLIARPAGLQWCLSVLDRLGVFGKKKKVQMKLQPLLNQISSACYEGLVKDSRNSRRSVSFDCLRLSFFLVLKILPGGGSSFRTRARPGGTLVLFFFRTALNEVSFVPSLRCRSLSRHREIPFHRQPSRS